MNSIYKQIATISIIIFFIAFLLDVLKVFEYDFSEIRSLAVIIYLVSSLKHYRLSLKKKDATINDLKNQLKKYKSHS